LLQENIKAKALSAFKWSFLSRIIPILSSLVSQLFLARLLNPSDYGIVGISTSVIALTLVFQGGKGIGQALVQHKDESEATYGNALVLNLGLGLFLYILLILASPLLAIYTKDNRVISVIMVQGISILFASVSSIYQSKLQRSFDFKKITGATLFQSTIPLCIGVALAYFNFKYWSLVIMSLSTEMITLTFLFIVLKWFPKIQYSKNKILELFKYSKWIMMDEVISWIISNVDNLILAHYFTISQIGLYVFGKRIGSLILGNVVSMISPLMFPYLCKLNGNDNEQKNAFLSISKIFAVIIFPIAFGVALIAPKIIPLVFSSKWKESGIIVSIIVLAEMTYLILPNIQLISAKGRPDINTKINITNGIIFFIGYLCAIKLGFLFFVYTKLIGLLFIPVFIYYASKLLKISKFYFIPLLKSPFIASVGMALVSIIILFAFRNCQNKFINFASVGIVIISAPIIYISTLWLIDKSIIKSISLLVIKTLKPINS